jgi:hypothetical protein
MATITTYGYTNFFDHGRVSEVQDWSSEQIDITYPGGYSTFWGFGFAWVEANEWWQGTATGRDISERLVVLSWRALG